MTLQATKAALRNQVRARLSGLSPERRAADSTAACALLRRQAIWQEAESILFYAPMAAELDVWALLSEALAEGKVAALPRYLPDAGTYAACEVKDAKSDVARGHLGIREPLAKCRRLPLKLDLILVPGIAFDLCCRRLGRGKGFYDQLLATARGTTCGVGFDEQIVPEVPVEPHDMYLSCILTPTRWLQR